MTHMRDDSHPATAVVSLGRPTAATGAPLNSPITLTSTFVSEGVAQPGEPVYARFGNPSWDGLEAAIGALEGGELPGLSYASGMAAVAAAFALAPIGSIVVVPTTSYNGTIGLARKLHAEGAIVLREIDGTQVEATIAAFEGAALVCLESPTNPLLDVLDLTRLVAAAKSAGATVVVDNTFSTPLRQRPLALGADVVVHSATKFIAGHSDVIMGLVVTNDATIRERLLADRSLRGGIAGPFEAWLALRGLRTLAVRLDRAEANAAELAQRLAVRPELSRVRYPGLPDDPSHALASAQFDGFGAMIAVEFAAVQGSGTDQDDTASAAADRFVGALRLITPATSLGGVESLAERRRRHAVEPMQVPASLVRLSIGIEHVEDLWLDLAQALDASRNNG